MATEILDNVVARAVATARQMERALHDKGTWTMQWGPFRVPALKVVGNTSVIFTAFFPDSCYLERPPGTCMLLCDDDIVSVRDIIHPGDGEFVIDWVLSPTPVRQPA